MPKAIDVDLQERIIAWRYEFGWTVKQIANAGDISTRTVYKFLELHRLYGRPVPPRFKRMGRPRHLVSADLEYIAGLLEAQPTIQLAELQAKINAAEALVSIATLLRTLERMGLSNKSVAREAQEQDLDLRATWRAVIGRIDDPSCFVWLDESGVDNLTTLRRRGWAKVGTACVTHQTFLRGKKHSVLPALTTSGIIVLDIFEGSINKERFLSFLRQRVVPNLGPYPGPRSVVILDNASIHHDAETRRAIEETGAKLIYLPPYSPDYNPIEQSFGFMKAWLRRHEHEVHGTESIPWLIYRAMQAITPELAAEWAWACGYITK